MVGITQSRKVKPGKGCDGSHLTELFNTIENVADESSVRKRKRLSVEEKLAAGNFARSRSFREAQQRFGVSRSALFNWLKEDRDLHHAQQSPTQFAQSDTSAENRHSPQMHSVISTSLPTSVSTPTTTASTTSIGTQTETSCTPTTCPPGNNASQGRLHRLPEATRIADGTESTAEDTGRSLLIGNNGEYGGFDNIAAQRAFSALQALDGRPFELTSYPQVVHILDAIGNEELDYGLVSTDTLLSTLSQLALSRVISSRLRLVGEVACDEQISVCGLLGTEIGDADCIMSDMLVLARSEEYIDHLEGQHSHAIHRLIVWDSATACRLLHEEQAANTLVLCSEEAAHANGLVVLQARIDNAHSSKYTIAGRRDSTALAFANQKPDAATSRLQSTLVIYSAGRAHLFDVVRAFSLLNLPIEHFSLRNTGDEPTRTGQSCVVSYQATADAAMETTLDRALISVADRVVHLGKYPTHTL